MDLLSWRGERQSPALEHCEAGNQPYFFGFKCRPPTVQGLESRRPGLRHRVRAISAETVNARAVEDEAKARAAADTDLETKISDEASLARAEEGKLQAQITSLLSNADESALNSLSELVADYTDNGVTITTSLNAEIERAQAAEAAAVARLDAIEAMLLALQAS